MWNIDQVHRFIKNQGFIIILYKISLNKISSVIKENIGCFASSLSRAIIETV